MSQQWAIWFHLYLPLQEMHITTGCFGLRCIEALYNLCLYFCVSGLCICEQAWRYLSWFTTKEKTEEQPKRHSRRCRVLAVSTPTWTSLNQTEPFCVSTLNKRGAEGIKDSILLLHSLLGFTIQSCIRIFFS
jgi:hypothetical protein